MPEFYEASFETMSCSVLDYVDKLQQLLMDVLDNPRPFQKKIEAIEVPPALSAEYERPGSDEDLTRWSRFAPES